jgi:hypothetical protein
MPQKIQNLKFTYKERKRSSRIFFQGNPKTKIERQEQIEQIT